jgi:O-antigen/teichoic acid export membrane protein
MAWTKKVLKKLKGAKQGELLKGGSVALIYRVLGMGFSYALLWAIARSHGTEGVGQYYTFVYYTTVFTVLSALGLSSSVIRSVAEYRVKSYFGHIRDLYSGVLRTVLPLGLLVGTAIFFGAGFLAQVVNGEQDLVTAFRILGCTLPFSTLLLVNVEFIRGWKKVAISEFFRTPAVVLVTLLVLLGLFFTPTPAYTPVLVYGCAVVLACAVTTVIIRRTIAQALPAAEDGSATPLNMREHLRMSLPMIVTSFIQMMNGRVDVLMLGAYYATSAVGIYSVAVKIAVGTEFIISSIKSIAMPKISELYWSGQKDELHRTMRFTAKLIFLLTSPIMLVLVLFAEPLLRIAGPDFVEGATSLRILALTHFVCAVSGMVGAFMNMTGDQVAFTRMVVVSIVVNVLLNLLLMGPYGMNGAALAAGLSYMLWNLWGAVYIWQKHRIRTFYWPFSGAHVKK